MPSSEDSAGLCPSRVSIDNGMSWQNTIKFQWSENVSTDDKKMETWIKHTSYSLVLFRMCGMNSIQTGLIGLGLLRFIRFPLSKALMYKDSLIILLSVFRSLSKYATFPQSISWEGFFCRWSKKLLFESPAFIASLCPRSLHSWYWLVSPMYVKLQVLQFLL